MKTHIEPTDIETDCRHHDLRRYRAQSRGAARRQTKQVLSHLSRAAGGVPAEEEAEAALQFSGAWPAEITVE